MLFIDIKILQNRAGKNWRILNNLPVRAEALYIFSRTNAFALTGRQYYGNSVTQGVASLALGYVLLPFQGVQACILVCKTMQKNIMDSEHPT